MSEENEPPTPEEPENLPETIPIDPRFPNTNQTRYCYVMFADYHRCIQLFDAEHADCILCNPPPEVNWRLKMERNCSEEHEEGEIIDDFEDISDYSIPSTSYSGKSVSHQDLLQGVSLSSISDNEPDSLIYETGSSGRSSEGCGIDNECECVADRHKAYTACESFKETSPLEVEAGLYLAAGTQHSLVARHFGLQLMEHTVKYRWTQISQQEKIFIKENAMKLLSAGGISDEPHMKDALSRVVVEMVKREWPQQWPGLLAELSDACAYGEIQTELVLLVFLRLVEDVALLQIVNRKGKLEERKPLLILFNDDPMQCIAAASKLMANNLDDHHYLFKKKLIQVLAGLGAQLCSLWDAVVAFSSHSSLTLAHLANPIWNSMMKHDQISRDPMFLSYISEWVQCTAPKIIKLNYSYAKTTTDVTNPASYYKLDFDSEDEYTLYFYRCRSDFLDTFRQATVISPLVTFSYVEQWLVKCLQVPNTTFGLAVNDPFHQEWEALATCLESVLSRVLQAQERPSIPAGLRLLQLCLGYQPADPLILSTLLTCISALFVFLSMSSGQMAPSASSVAMSGAALLPQVLEKIFSALVYTAPGQTRDTRSRAVKNVRRHAASLMVKIGNKYPLLLLPMFDQIRLTVDNLSRHDGPAQLSTLEKVTLQEALLLISNHFCDYDRQSSFVGEVMRDANAQWLSVANAGAFKGAIEFMTFVGLNKSPNCNSESENISGANRSNLVYCVNLLLGAVKRCAWPDDPERATRGGFVVASRNRGIPSFIPDYRLRPIIRVFLKPFIYSCPQPFYEAVLLPIIAHIGPIMVTKLNTKWQQVNELRSRESQDDNADAQEVLEDILTRALTREYLDVLKVALVGGSLTPEAAQDTMETEELSMDGPPPPTRNNMTAEVISELGIILLRSEKTCQSLVLAVLGALSWIDSNGSLKATYLTGPIIRQLVADNSLNGEMAAHIMAAVLNALTLHGQHEANQGSLLTLGAQMYEMLRPTFPEVLAVMQQILAVNPVDLQKLDERISGSTSKGNKVEKVKKDLFKKITGTLLGKSVGQLFKKEVKIHELPRIVLTKKVETKEHVPDLRNLFNA
ncbi:exportin 1/5 [Holotrichia oblita]|uniref:Exportin 1/5 n=1 Tax=Holotrichia oblita TaxID=644536 RepID=A0ACB9TB27_HOLOL|nr:exportin 1/5 [Holotrichia oblita]